ncbi:MAG TPA: Trk system potassium transporter TrkA [Kiritimatiellia bacterium]|nr:Trk system potassium transporter TrkA [Kiritimatiellia bacterium]HMP00601.1 Trk system potassium transporter TrkA [Kiritimatiellia bacterium]
MRIVIIGAGNAGKHLASRLSMERHDIVMIDRDADKLASVQAHVDVQTIQGEGTDPWVLEEAGISKTDLFVAVTNRDEVNILACALAHLVGVPMKVARVASGRHYEPDRNFDLKRLGIDLVVSQKEECAEEIFRILRMPGTTEAVDMLDQRALVVGIRVHMDSPMILQTLRQFPSQELIERIRFIAVLRGDEVMIPAGDTQFMIGDDVFLVGSPEDVEALLEWASPDHVNFQKIVIAGGGDLGLELARRLDGKEIPAVLIEKDIRRAEYCSQQLDRVTVLHGDALSPETLDAADVVRGTAFVAATGDDETNIMICLLGEKSGANFTIAQVAKPDYVPVIARLSLLDRAVSSHISMINAILHFVRGKNVKAAAILHRLPGELLEVALTSKTPWTGKAIRSLKLPPGLMIATVMRADVLLPANGNLQLAAGDRLVLFSLPKAVAKVEALFGE